MTPSESDHNPDCDMFRLKRSIYHILSYIYIRYIIYHISQKLLWWHSYQEDTFSGSGRTWQSIQVASTLPSRITELETHDINKWSIISLPYLKTLNGKDSMCQPCCGRCFNLVLGKCIKKSLSIQEIFTMLAGRFGREILVTNPSHPSPNVRGKMGTKTNGSSTIRANFHQFPLNYNFGYFWKGDLLTGKENS